jgi:hypothetical protein
MGTGGSGPGASGKPSGDLRLAWATVTVDRRLMGHRD